MAKAKIKKRSSKSRSKNRDKIAIAIFAGLVVVGIAAIVIASINAVGSASKSADNSSQRAAEANGTSSGDTQSGSQAANDTQSTSASPPTLDLLAQPTGELQIIDIKTGEGEPAANGMKLEVHYTGYLEDGTVFDSSLSRGQTYSFTLGSGRVIKGWDQGLVGMQPGGERQLIIPPDLAYGDNDYNSIPGGSTLIFNVELISLS